MHFSRKYVPTRCPVPDDSAFQVVHVRTSPGRLDEAPEGTWPPPGARMRVSKANKGAVVVKAVRRHPSPQPASLESLEAAWSDSRQYPESVPSPERRNADTDAADNGLEGHLGGGPLRSRRRGFRPPDVRTIFSPGEKDPRVKQETGEGHNFEPGGEDTWCDLCCHYIFQQGLTCAGKRPLHLPDGEVAVVNGQQPQMCLCLLLNFVNFGPHVWHFSRDPWPNDLQRNFKFLKRLK